MRPVCATLTLLALVPPRPATAQGAAPAERVRWIAPERAGCPAEAVVNRELAALLSKGRAEARASARIEARVRAAKEGGFVLELTVEDRLGPRTRALSTHSCVLAARAAALIAALVLEQGDSAPAPLSTTTTVASVAAAASSTASAALSAKIRRALVAAQVIPDAAPDPAPSRLYVMALVAVDSGRAPSATVVVTVGAGLRWGRLGLGVSAAFSPWTRGFFPGRLDAGADLRTFAASLEGAWAFTDTDPVFSLGARLEAGVLSGRGFGLEASTGTLDRLWLAVCLGPTVRAEIFNPINLLLRIELSIPMVRPTFEAVQGEALYRPPPISVAASIGLELFP